MHCHYNSSTWKAHDPQSSRHRTKRKMLQIPVSLMMVRAETTSQTLPIAVSSDLRFSKWHDCKAPKQRETFKKRKARTHQNHSTTSGEPTPNTLVLRIHATSTSWDSAVIATQRPSVQWTQSLLGTRCIFPTADSKNALPLIRSCEGESWVQLQDKTPKKQKWSASEGHCYFFGLNILTV